MLSASVMMLIAAWLVLRSPNVGQGVAFFTTGIPTMATGEAVVAVLAWTVIVIAASAAVWNAAVDIKKRRPDPKTFSTASILLAVGFLLFAFGALQRALPTSSICCGSGSVNVREAISLAR
jgi:heme/copper-type cytochrome/quinol oxidase subunit 3